MKQIMLALGLVAVLHLQAQKKDIKLYAFSQSVSKGMRKTTVDEKGDLNTEKKSNSNILFLFLEVPAGLELNITELWINGVKYRFESAPEKTPVILNTGLRMPGQKETVLIPLLVNEVIRLIPLEKMAITEKNMRKIVNQKPLVVFYTVRGKNYHSSVEKLEEVAGLVME